MAIKKLWVLEDDPAVANTVVRFLHSEFDVMLFKDFESLKAAFLNTTLAPPYAALLDIYVGKEILWKFLDSFRIPCPVFVVSGSNQIEDMRAAFKYGARAFIPKPINENLLKVSLEILAQEQAPSAEYSMSFGLVKLNVSRLSFEFKGKTLDNLTPNEFKILSLLTRCPQGVSKDEIFSACWNEVHLSKELVYVHVSNLRKKLAALGLNVTSIAGGYCLVTLN